MGAFLVEYKCVVISGAPCLWACKKQGANGILWVLNTRGSIVRSRRSE
jgi:hypothetical protein